MIKKPIKKETKKVSKELSEKELKQTAKKILKAGFELFSKVADKYDDDLVRFHKREVASVISKYLLKIIVNDTPVDREIEQAMNVILGFEQVIDTTNNEWIDILKDSLLRIEIQYYSDDSKYLAEIIVLYIDENISGQKKPKAIKLQTEFKYDDLPQELRHSIFEAMNNNQTCSYELYTKE